MIPWIRRNENYFLGQMLKFQRLLLHGYRSESHLVTTKPERNLVYVRAKCVIAP